jgi:hypothetical protein
MSIVLPIFFFAVCVGLFTRRMTPRVWYVMAFWIALVIAYHYLRN